MLCFPTHAQECRESHILVVDDSEFDASFIKKVFSLHGFNHVAVLTDSYELIQNVENYNPDLVILDLLMPKINGYDVCKLLRQHKKFSTTPILVQSGLKDSEEVKKAFNVGATDYISKPIKTDELISRSFVHLENKILMQELTEYKERIAEELTQACKMQQQIMPSSASISKTKTRYGVDIACHYAPSYELSGDFWGIKYINDSAFVIYAGDICGHGVTAALNAFRLQTLIDTSDLPLDKPDEALGLLNNYLTEIFAPGHFLTMFYAVVDVTARKICYASAGAPGPILMHAQGEYAELNAVGTPLGIIPDAQYTTHEVSIEPGDSVTIFSDALFETYSPKLTFLDQSDISACIRTRVNEPAEVIKDEIVFLFNQHRSRAPITDDLTLIVLQF